MIFKRYVPRSLFGRALLIFILPMILLQAVVAYVFVQRHFEGATRQMARAVALELNYAVEVVEQAKDAEAAQAELDELAAPLGMKFGVAEGQVVAADAIREFYDIPGGAIEQAFKEGVTRPMALDLVSDSRTIDARVQTAKGVLRVLIPRSRMIAKNPEYLLFWMFGAAFGLILIAIFFLNKQIQPIRALAKAAEEFGKGRDLAFRPRGAEEVKKAGAAFLDMKARLERQIRERTKMLSGVSHDLRTPLTRMKLALALVDDGGSEMKELRRDVDEMERMLAEFLAFAKGESGEEISEVDPVRLAEEVAADARRRGAQVSVFATVDTPDDATARLRRMAVKRALANLVGNAVEFGSRIEVTARVARKFIEFTVEDDGPGIPAEAREAAFRPFERLDPARNQDKGGGVGLGLSIALDIARSHGGELTLHESERLGGLKARFRAPR